MVSPTKIGEFEERQRRILVLVAILIVSVIGIVYSVLSIDAAILLLSIIGTIVSALVLYYMWTHPIKQSGL